MYMFLKLFFISVISCTQAEPLLRRLYGMKGGLQVTACSTSGAHCEGAVFLADWVVVLDSCIRAQDIKEIYVRKGIFNCTQETTIPAIATMRESSMRGVAARFSHPLAPDVDLALLRLQWPYEDVPDNRMLSSKALNLFLIIGIAFNSLDIWMEGVLYTSTENTVRDVTNSYMQYRMYTTSIKMFFITVILPSASFIIFFLYIVFYTGTTDTSKIPYKTLNNDNKSSHV